MTFKRFGVYELPQLHEELEATGGAAYVHLPHLSDVCATALEEAEKFLLLQPPDEADAEEKTMFPAKLANAPELPPRKVRQLFPEGTPHPRPQLPDYLAFLCAVLETQMRHLGNRLVEAAAVRYGFGDELKAQLLREDERSLNLVQYVSVEGREGQLSFPTHRDWGLYSKYPAIGAEGLEVKHNGAFVPVGPAVNGDVLVYAGMVMQKLSGGRLPAAAHHVKQKTAHHRTVLLSYDDPPRDLVLPGGQTVGEYMDAKLRKIGQIP